MTLAPFAVLVAACATGYSAYTILDRLPIN